MTLPAVLRGGLLAASLPALVIVSIGASEDLIEVGADAGADSASGEEGRAPLSRRLAACPAGPWEAGCPGYSGPGCLVEEGDCSCQQLQSVEMNFLDGERLECVHTYNIGMGLVECLYCAQGFWAVEPLTTFDLAQGRVWEDLGMPFPSRDGSVCRGDNEDDNNPLHYEVHNGVMTLESCKAKCLQNLPLCKGVEYGPGAPGLGGRCELWKRHGGLHATLASSTGWSCHRFGWPVHQLQPADGVSDDGAGHACRGESSDDNSESYYDLTQDAADLEDCKARCAAAPVCFGLEFGSDGRCEIWTRAIHATRKVPGFTCLRLDPDTLPPTVTTTPTAPRVPGEWIISGPCHLDEADNACVTSPNYPGVYGNEESCTMHIYGDAVKYLDVKDFHTAGSYDRLTFSEFPHHGFWGNSDTIKRRVDGWQIRGTIQWSTDRWGVARGWKLCARDTPPTTTTNTLTSTTATTATTSTATTSTAVIGEWVVTGPCAVVPGEAECITSPNFPSSYGNGERCGMSIWGGAGLTKYLWVEDFSTEFGSDWFYFGNRASGSGNDARFHSWEIGGTELHWSSDSSGVARGWKVCARDFPPPTTTTASTTGVPGTWMTPTSSFCILDSDDIACVMTRNYPRYNYGNLESCELSLWGNVSMYLEVQGFETQYGRDFLTVNGVQHSGDVGPPQGVLIDGPVLWSSDSRGGARGWKICARDFEPTTTTSSSGTPGSWKIQSSSSFRLSGCYIIPEDPACVATAGYPSQNYWNNDVCELSLWGDAPRYLEVQFFETQDGRDILTVNGHSYSGSSRPPQGALIQGPVRWSADHSTTACGWKICARESVAEVMTLPTLSPGIPIFP